MKNDLDLAKRYISAIKKATERGIIFNLTFAQYKLLRSRKRCYYSGRSFNDQEQHPHSRTLDRVDPTKGYEQGNVVPCCKNLNQLKAIWENPIQKMQPEEVAKVLTKMGII